MTDLIVMNRSFYRKQKSMWVAKEEEHKENKFKDTYQSSIKLEEELVQNHLGTHFYLKLSKIHER